MHVKPENSRLLMSEALKGRLPAELEDEAAETLGNQAISAVIKLKIGDKSTAVIGILRSVLFEKEPELEARVALDDAFNIVSSQNVTFLGFELHYGEKAVVKVDGPFVVKGVRLDEVDALNQLCLLSLGLKRPAA